MPELVQTNLQLNEKEKNLIRMVHDFPTILTESGNSYNPSLIANFIYDLVREYNQFYHEYSILKEENRDIRDLRLLLSRIVSDLARNGMELLGIEMPERM
jgi:arginyl-tRNA synthetase